MVVENLLQPSESQCVVIFWNAVTASLLAVAAREKREKNHHWRRPPCLYILLSLASLTVLLSHLMSDDNIKMNRELIFMAFVTLEFGSCCYSRLTSDTHHFQPCKISFWALRIRSRCLYFKNLMSLNIQNTSFLPTNKTASEHIRSMHDFLLE